MRDRLSVFGIDIVKGSVRSRSRRPMYALVRMDGQAILSENTVSMFRLFRLLAEERPDILAVDSLQEISTDGRLYKESYRDAQLAGTPGVAGGAR